MANNIDRAIKLCNEEPDRALARVLKAGLTRANRTKMEIEDSIEEAKLEVTPQLTNRTNYLATFANVATLTGLLGTIQGLIQAFAAVATANAESKQTLLAAGISTAMYTTMGGLIVAIPGLLLSAFLVTKTNKILDDIDLYSQKSINLLGTRLRNTGEEQA
jgi:biopolymer transport protein ExbB/TolQ